MSLFRRLSLLTSKKNLLFDHFAFDLNNIGEVWHLEDVVVFSLILSFSSFLEGNWAKISSDDVKKRKRKKEGQTQTTFTGKCTSTVKQAHLWCWTGWRSAPVTGGPVHSDLLPAVMRRRRLEEDPPRGESAVYTPCCTIQVNNRKTLGTPGWQHFSNCFFHFTGDQRTL